MRLPILLSVPHAGRRVPPEAAPYCILSADDIRRDGDEFARRIYALGDEVERFVTTDVARAIVDQNRAPDDFRKDGVVKSHTCWDVPVYDRPLPPSVVDLLLAHHHTPYHARLSAFAADDDVVVGVDGHTMAATAPPVGPDPGQERPRICLSDAHGTLPEGWMAGLVDAMEDAFGFRPSVNEPFQGGYIIRHHARELPWVQIEFNRGPFLSPQEKRDRLLKALTRWCETTVLPAVAQRR